MERPWLVLCAVVIGLVIAVVAVVPGGASGDGGFPPPPSDGGTPVKVTTITVTIKDGTAYDYPSLPFVTGQYMEWTTMTIEAGQWTTVTKKYSLIDGWLHYLQTNPLGLWWSSEYQITFTLTNRDTNAEASKTVYIQIPSGTQEKQFKGAVSFSNAVAGNYLLTLSTNVYFRRGFADYRQTVQCAFAISVDQTGQIAYTVL